MIYGRQEYPLAVTCHDGDMLYITLVASTPSTTVTNVQVCILCNRSHVADSRIAAKTA